MVKKFQKLSCSVSFMLTLTWGSDMLFEMLRRETGNKFEKHPLYYASLGWVFMQSLPSVNIINGDLHVDALIIRAY